MALTAKKIDALRDRRAGIQMAIRFICKSASATKKQSGAAQAGYCDTSDRFQRCPKVNIGQNGKAGASDGWD
jgi:hypothetical protein